MEHITTLIYKGHTFEIVKTEDGYHSVEDKYIDYKTGQLNRTLNGIQTLLMPTLERCMEMTMTDVDVKELIEQGVPLLEAIKTVFELKAKQEVKHE